MGSDGHYVRVKSPESPRASRMSKREWIFDELPQGSVSSVCRSEELGQFQLLYTIELKYKQFKWTLVKKATQVFMLHLDLKKRILLEGLHEKQEQVKEWLQGMGSGEIQDYEQESSPPPSRSISMSRDVPSAAAFPVMRPALGRLPTISRKATINMQNYLDHFLNSLDIVNTREVCKFLGVSKLSFAPEYGPKLREGYVRVKHLPPATKERGCSCCSCFCSCFRQNWQKVWAVLKPGFLALLADPLDPKPIDIIVFDILAPSGGSAEGQISLAKLEENAKLLKFGYVVTCGNRVVHIRTKGSNGARDWVAAINDAGLRPPEGWCHPHRFGSFAPPRGIKADGSEAQWFIDGRAAFDAIASAIENAKSEIFIADWWFCPELYLRRPYSLHEYSRLDTLLGAKAREGVQVYVLLYKEVALALKINSLYTKRRLLAIHENIKVLRFPDHFSSGIYLWSHHEKIVIVDQRIGFLGGLDLCFGRYDDRQHVLHDKEAKIWPGKDYYNPRESEPNSWEDTARDELDRQSLPRMPWHDVQCAIWGPPCRDVARHFVQRWNYAKRNKAPNEQTIPLLLPQHHMVIPHYLTGNEAKEAIVEEEEELRKASMSAKPSFHDLPTLLPATEECLNGDEFGANDVMKTFLRDGTSLTRSASQVINGKHASDLQMHSFVEEEIIVDSTRWKKSDDVAGKEWWEIENRLLQRDSDDFGEVGPRVRCHCQVVRSVGQWSAGTSKLEETSIHSAYCSLIDRAEHFVYIENQFFISGLDGDTVIQNRVLQSLYTRIVRAYRERQCFRVIVVLPLLPGFQGGVDDSGAASVRAIMHWQYRTICRGNHSILKRLRDELGSEVDNYISFYGLRQRGRLSHASPLLTSQIYVHSKILIVDDKAALIGSANINDRSLLGSRDSEIGVVIEDDEYIDSVMNGCNWKAGKFAHSLRVSLWAEHLGLHSSEVNSVKDPVSETTYRDVWMSRAQLNTKQFDAIFGCIPNDHVHSRMALRQATVTQKERVGQASIDLGVAKKKEELSPDDVDDDDGIKGHVVCFPLNFMKDEDLRPVFNESEFYASAQVYH